MSIEDRIYFYDNQVYLRDTNRENFETVLTEFERLLLDNNLWEEYYTEKGYNLEWTYSPENKAYYMIVDDGFIEKLNRLIKK